MKKLIFAFALVFGIMSCTNSAETVNTTDSTEVVDSIATDTVAVDNF